MWKLELQVVSNVDPYRGHIGIMEKKMEATI